MYVVTAVTTFTCVLLVSLPCVAAPLIWPYLREPGADRELAYGMLMKQMLPHGLLGLRSSGCWPGVMSTVSDNINFGSQVMLSDLYQRWVRTGTHPSDTTCGPARRACSSRSGCRCWSSTT